MAIDMAIDMALAPGATAHVHPELRSLVGPLSRVIGDGPLTVERLPALRATIPGFLPTTRPTPPWAWHAIPGRAGAPDVRVILVDPGGGPKPRPGILHLHGGGFVMGGAEHSLWRSQELARSLDCLVASVEYRLAPETVFPGALEDGYAALRWLHDAADTLRVDRHRIAIVGESAGGGHAAMLAIAARDRGEFPVAYQALIYPMLDDRTGSTVRTPPHVGTLLWDEQRNRFGWTSMLGTAAGSADVAHGSVPARVADLRGLPPTWIGVGSIDLLVDEGIRYAARLIDAGVSTRLTVVPGAFHVFDAFPAFAVANAFRTDLIASLRAALGSAVPG